MNVLIIKKNKDALNKVSDKILHIRDTYKRYLMMINVQKVTEN